MRSGVGETGGRGGGQGESEGGGEGVKSVGRGTDGRGDDRFFGDRLRSDLFVAETGLSFEQSPAGV